MCALPPRWMVAVVWALALAVGGPITAVDGYLNIFISQSEVMKFMGKYICYVQCVVLDMFDFL